MNFSDKDGQYFLELFTLAQAEALTERESQIVTFRYGLIDGECYTLETIGKQIGVSRERVRQILNKSLHKIVSKGRQELRKGKTDQPCAQLLSFVQNVISSASEGLAAKLANFVETELFYLPVNTALNLAAYLSCGNRRSAKIRAKEALTLIKQHKSVRYREHKQRIFSEKFQMLLVDVIWPTSTVSYKPSDFVSLEQKRNVNPNGEGKSGKYYSAKMKREVQYESKLELEFFWRLEQLDEIVFYQEQPFRVPYEYEGKGFVYYPDVLVILENGKAFVVEIKPVFQMALHVNLSKWTGLKRFCFENGFGILITDGARTIQQMLHHDINPRFAASILDALKVSPLSWYKYKSIRDIYKAKREDFLALVLRYKLVWKLSPFTLSLPDNCGG